jgi:AGCS family alanine or glycine:cation symporter
MVGIVTFDDAMDILEEEATEDMELMGGMMPSEKTYLKSTAFDLFRNRIPWLMLLMVSATFTGLIITAFEGALAAQVALTAFIPMLMGTGGNSGAQSSVTIIRALSLDEGRFSDIWRILRKELLTAFLCGISLAVVCFANIGYWPAIFADIFKGAFTPSGVTGGVVGSMMLVITWGVKRGVFSNEAGLGSAPMAHAASSEKDPVRQGMYGIFEVFMDTIVICTLSGLTVLCGVYSGGVEMTYGVQGDTSLNAMALGTVFSSKGGAIIIALCLALFAFSTVLSWGMYGTRCCEFLFGTKSIKVYQILFVLVVVVGATMDLGLAWDIADTLNGLMAIPNLIALVGLSGIVVKETKDYFENRIKNYQ